LFFYGGRFVIRRKRRVLGALIAAASLLAAACYLGGEAPAEEAPAEEEAPQEEDPSGKNPAGEEDPQEPADFRGSLDPRLYGLWRFTYGGRIMEEIEITAETKGEGNLGSLSYRGIYSSAELSEAFAADIVYAESFSDRTGVLIVEYWPGHKQVWIDWGASFYPYEMVPLSPQPPGTFYGIYFLRLNDEGTVVMLACTSDQNNNYGPTEAATLEEAVAKFTEENRPLWMHMSVGDPQEKVEDVEDEEDEEEVEDEEHEEEVEHEEDVEHEEEGSGL
jgi:hypothetical protein